MVFKGSRYTRTPAYIKQGETLVLEMRERVKFDLSNATYYTVVQGDTLDGIAYKEYGNAQYYWAIMDANPQYQSEIEIKAGDILCIPPFEEVVKVSE